MRFRATWDRSVSSNVAEQKVVWRGVDSGEIEEIHLDEDADNHTIFLDVSAGDVVRVSVVVIGENGVESERTTAEITVPRSGAPAPVTNLTIEIEED